MKNVTLYEYVRQTGLETPDVVLCIVGTLVLGCGVYFTIGLLKPTRRPQNPTYNDILTPFWALFITAVCFLIAYSATRTRYLLRDGTSRYTVAQVTKYGTRRGYRQFSYHYKVTGTDHQGVEDCGVSQNRELPCPPLGTRFYMQFSPEDPSVEQITQLEVPDSITTAPPMGWERLPE